MNTQACPKKAENIRWIERKNGAILLDPAKGVYLKLNRTAADIWRACDGTKDIDEMSKDMVKIYNIDDTCAARDAAQTVKYLSKAGFIKISRYKR